MQFNIIAVFIAAAVSMAIGYAWFSPGLFGKQWAELAGVNCEENKKNAGKNLFLGYLMALVLSFTIEYLYTVIQIPSYTDAYWLAIILWAGFIASIEMGGVIWEKKPVRLFTINATYQLINMITLSIILYKF